MSRGYYWMFANVQHELLVQNKEIFQKFLQDIDIRYICICRNENEGMFLRELYILSPKQMELADVKSLVMTDKWQCLPVASFPVLKPLKERKNDYVILHNL